MGEDFIWKMNKNEKTKAVVWDTKMVAMKPEKNIWAAEIEIYRWVMSNGPYGFTKIWKRSVCFWIFWLEYRRVIVDTRFLMFSCPRRFWKLQFRSPKLIFGEILIKNIFFWFLSFWFLIFLYFSPHLFFDFSDICKFRWKIFFWWWFPLFLFTFGPKILPELPL